MVSYLVRIGGVLLRQAFKPRTEVTEVHEITYRAWPWWCDTYWHINNTNYLALMELSRWAWVARAGWLYRATEGRWTFIVAGIQITYRRAIGMFEGFKVRTQLAGCDERWYYLVQELVKNNGEIASRAVVRARISRRGKPIPPRELLGEWKPSSEFQPEIEAFDRAARKSLERI